MVQFSVEVSGLEGALKQFDRIEDAEAAITDGLVRGAAKLVETIQDKLGTAFPPASSAGEPPHLRTGALRRSVRIERVDPLEVTISAGGAGTLVPYAEYLEFGTSQMEPRPYFLNTVIDVLPILGRIMQDTLNRYLEKVL